MCVCECVCGGGPGLCVWGELRCMCLWGGVICVCVLEEGVVFVRMFVGGGLIGVWVWRSGCGWVRVRVVYNSLIPVLLIKVSTCCVPARDS